MVLSGIVTVAWQLFSILNDRTLARIFVSDGLRDAILHRFGARGPGVAGDVQISFMTILIAVLAIAFGAWLGGSVWISRRRGWTLSMTAATWGFRGWVWWLMPLVGEVARLIGEVSGQPQIGQVYDATIPLWWSLQTAGWLATGWTLACVECSAGATVSSLKDDFRATPAVWSAVFFYTVCFTLLNWGLSAALMLPHGDSAMYEEHLWNLLHGKGFRSYLDNGRLFLGEHIQVIHVLLVPLYVLWPSQLLLEFCQSAALAVGAIPVYWLARRHSGSRETGFLLAGAYLLYIPMQYLDIAVDFKTFRPNSFEIPLLLFALDALERQRYRSFLVFLFFTLLCQEDAATVIAPLGVWIALRQGASLPDHHPWKRRVRWLGTGLFVAGTAYVLFVIAVALPYFRQGQDVHFASYFDKFGKSPGEIVRTLAGNPLLLLHEWLDGSTWVFLGALLLPLGSLSLLSPGRLAVAAPLFGVLCLNELTRSPLHHFHAPIVPIVVWAAAAGLGVAPRFWTALVDTKNRWLHLPSESDLGGEAPVTQRITKETCVPNGRTLPVKRSTIPQKVAAPCVNTQPTLRRVVHPASQFAGQLALLTALITGIWSSLGPLGINFWDSHSPGYWKKKYLPGKRTALFAEVLEQIPTNSRVASTDFVHPRFTHFERSYDYSDYRPTVPDDTDFIVIDVHGPYSKVRSPRDVKEFREAPDKWELLPDRTGGYFIVLKRRGT